MKKKIDMSVNTSKNFATTFDHQLDLIKTHN